MKRINPLRLTCLFSALCSGLLALSAAPARAAEFTCPDLHNKEKLSIGEMSQGKDGWFFRLSGDLRQEFQLMPESVNYLTRLAKAFEKRGTAVVFMPIPTRGMVEMEYLDDSQPGQDRFQPEEARISFRKMLESLRGTGLIVPDLLEASDALQEEDKDFFFHRDHHWTPFGARTAAHALRDAIKEHPNYKSLTPATYESREVSKQEMKHTMALEIQRLCTSGIPAEPYPQFETQLKASGADALFGDAGGSEPAILVGSSFSGEDSFNFAGFLSETTGLSIANHALSAGLLFNAIVSYTSSPQFEKDKPPFLIWEAPGLYDLNVNTEQFFRQIIPAVHGVCDGKTAIATGKASIKGGKTVTLMEIPAEKQVAGSRYYLFLESSNRGFAKFTLVLDHADEDGEWFTIDRSQYFNNSGRFFVELTDEIESPLVKITLDGLPDLNAEVSARLCKVVGESGLSQVSLSRSFSPRGEG